MIYHCFMAIKRIHVEMKDPQYAILRELAAKWGLSLSAAVRHSLMRSAEQEGISLAKPGKSTPRQ